MVQEGGAAVCNTYRNIVGYSATVTGRVGAYYPYRLYAYCYAPGVGLPPYREWPARPGPGFSGKAGGKAPGPAGPGPWDSSGLLGSCIVSHSGANHAAACNCLGAWLLRFGFCGGSCSVFGAAQPLASPCQGEGDRRRRWKGGYVAESDIVVIEDRTYCFLYAAILRPSTSPPPSQLR